MRRKISSMKGKGQMMDQWVPHCSACSDRSRDQRIVQGDHEMLMFSFAGVAFQLMSCHL